MTDEALMLCVKQGDLQKAGILYERYKRKILAFFLYRNLNDREKSEDCMQQVFLRLIRYRESYKAENSFRTWIYTIARNVQKLEYEQLEKSNRLLQGYEVGGHSQQPGDDRGVVTYAMSLLPTDQRELLVMSKFLEMKYDEIARVHNCSVGVIKTRVFRAMKNLREIYFKVA